MCQLIRIALISNSQEKLSDLSHRFAHLDGLLLVGTSADLRSAKQQSADIHPDVLLVDADLPGSELISLVRWATDESEIHSLLLVGDTFDNDKVLQALEAGALGTISKDADDVALLSAFSRVQAGQPYLPDDLSYPLLQHAAGDLEIPASERRERLIQLTLTVIPVSAALTALLSILEGEYWERLGIRPEDLGHDPASRLAMLTTAVLLIAGYLGPLLFVTVWQDSICTWLRGKTPDGRGENSVTHWYHGWYGFALKGLGGTRGRIILGATLLALTTFIAYVAEPVLVVLIGPAVIAVLLINVLGLEDYIPHGLDLPRFRPKQVLVILGALVFIVATSLGYELLVVGPDLREDGVHNVMADLILDIEAFPVMVIDRVNGEERFGALLLGGDRGVHVLYDPCRKEALWVPVVQFDLKAIDEVSCSDESNPAPAN